MIFRSLLNGGAIVLMGLSVAACSPSGLGNEFSEDGVNPEVVPPEVAPPVVDEPSQPPDPAPTPDTPAPAPEPELCTPTITEGDFMGWGQTGTGRISECAFREHAIGGAAGTRIALAVSNLEQGEVVLEMVDFNGQQWFQSFVLVPGSSVEVDMPWSGEVLIRVVPQGDARNGADYGLTADCVANCSSAWSRYPILLMHGMGAPIPGASHFIGIADDLHAAGYQVFEPDVAAWNTTEERALEWRGHLDAWKAQGQWRKVHLIGHSLGGTDARYLAAHLDWNHDVVSITTIATPHRGSELADMMLGYTDPDSLTGGALQTLAEFFGPWIGSDAAQDVDGLMHTLSTVGMETFNANVYDRSDVVMRSWAGATCSWTNFDCQDSLGGESVGYDMLATFLLMPDVPNDGVVTVDSARWGFFQGVLAADHLDLNGSILGSAAFEPTDFYLREAERLAAIERGETGPAEPLVYTIE